MSARLFALTVPAIAFALAFGIAVACALAVAPIA